MSNTTGSEVTDKVIRGCVSEDNACQRIVYEHYYQRMFGICLRYSHNEDEAKDLLQEGFIKVFKYVKTFQGDSDFFAWLKRVFTNHCIDYVRSAYKKYITYVDALESDQVEDEYISETEEKVTKEEVFSAMNKLRPDYRLILNLYAIEKLSHAEIASRLNIKEVSSRSKLGRARNSLKKLLNMNG